MIPAAVPEDIVALHRALLAALRVDYFPPGMIEMNGWRDWLSVMKALEHSEGGPFTKKDLVAAVALMRAQNRAQSSNWSLRFAKIMRDPESFRDLVLIARKAVRERPAVQQTARTIDGVTYADETDPTLTANAQPVGPGVKEQMRIFREKMKGGPQ